uniref:hypothetical protein n=1 Tax=Metallibacterium scheffleri TaxID=993689 RepID=UPI0023F14901
SIAALDKSWAQLDGDLIKILRNKEAFLYEDGDSKLTYFGDLVPNTFYLKAGYLTAIDTYPMETIIQKKKLIKQAIREKRLCFFSHDMKIGAAFLSGDESNPDIEPVNVNE